MPIDLNCDLGEGFGAYAIGQDEQVLGHITSANIACGFHGGDPMVMNQTVSLALKQGVAIGAHPGYPDLMGFGRRYMGLSLDEIRTYTMYQIGALQAIVRAHGARLSHVKPHGALYNRAASDYPTARAIAEAIALVDESLVFLGLPFSAMERAANDVNITYACEAFADRAYTNKGELVSREQAGAIIHDPNEVVERVLRMVQENSIRSIDGVDVSVRVDSICLHGDNPSAVTLAQRLQRELLAAKVDLQPLKR